MYGSSSLYGGMSVYGPVYNPFSLQYAQLYAAQQQAAAQAAARAAMIRQRRIFENAKTNAARLQAADEARAEGDIRLACRLYMRVGADRSLDNSVRTARQRLAELKEEAIDKHSTITGRLASWLDTPEGAELSEEDAKALTECMTEFHALAERYGQVPGIGRTIKSTLSTHVKKPDVRKVICEPTASELWQLGQQFETRGHACCAMLVYEEATNELLPAPSAVRAEARLKELESDPQNVKAAKICRDLKWCHSKYPIAEKLTKGEPRQARELFQEITQRSPVDSRIHQEAQKQLAALR